MTKSLRLEKDKKRRKLFRMRKEINGNIANEIRNRFRQKRTK